MKKCITSKNGREDQERRKVLFSIRQMLLPIILIVSVSVGLFSVSSVFGQMSNQASHSPLDSFEGHPPFHVNRHATNAIVGLSPQQLYSVYQLSGSGGSGTIAIVDAYDDTTVQNDLKTFSSTFGLLSMPSCTSFTQSQCFEKHKMATKLKTNSGWALEESLDTQWAHAIAPSAHILLVEAKSASGTDLVKAVNYARSRSDVVAISMSWGGSEFSGESGYDGDFTSNHASFFASSGDSGTGVQWPAVSSNVIGVGGTTLTFTNGTFSSETAWSGSGGGLSLYEKEPAYQTTYGVQKANGFRAVPDVSFNANPQSGVAVYDSSAYQGQAGWFQVGGTSLGSPSWAAMRSLGGTNVTNQAFYADASNAISYSADFRDITSGTNGSCGFYCSASANYDYITGLGRPITIHF